MELKFTDFIEITTAVIKEEIVGNLIVEEMRYRIKDFDESYNLLLRMSNGYNFSFKYNYSCDLLKSKYYPNFINSVKEDFRESLLRAIEFEFNGGLKRND